MLCYFVKTGSLQAALRCNDKGRRAPTLPVEIIDPAEFVCLELDGVDAVDPRTGEPVFFDLLVCARELIEGKSEDSYRSEFSSASRNRDIGAEAKKHPPSVSDRNLRSWYEERVAELIAGGGAPSGQAEGEVAALLEAKRIKRVPVTRDGKVIGIISRANLVRALAATKGAPPREGEDDDRTIRARLVAELSREEWAKVWPEDIIVRDGVVHFWLSSDEPEENKQALRVAAETTSGVRGVEEHVLPAPVFPAF